MTLPSFAMDSECLASASRACRRSNARLVGGVRTGRGFLVIRFGLIHGAAIYWGLPVNGNDGNQPRLGDRDAMRLCGLDHRLIRQPGRSCLSLRNACASPGRGADFCRCSDLGCVRGGCRVAYSYGSPSVLRERGGGRELRLSTSGGVTEAGAAAEPIFFIGFLTDPAVAARGMLACAAVARSRYVRDPEVIAALRDPVVTSNRDRLRFEAFSSCCGVHARLDLIPGALEVAPVVSGTTNVDFNGAMRAALAGAEVSGPLL